MIQKKTTNQTTNIWISNKILDPWNRFGSFRRGHQQGRWRPWASQTLMTHHRGTWTRRYSLTHLRRTWTFKERRNPRANSWSNIWFRNLKFKGNKKKPMNLKNQNSFFTNHQHIQTPPLTIEGTESILVKGFFWTHPQHEETKLPAVGATSDWNHEQKNIDEKIQQQKHSNNFLNTTTKTQHTCKWHSKKWKKNKRKNTNMTFQNGSSNVHNRRIRRIQLSTLLKYWIIQFSKSIFYFHSNLNSYCKHSWKAKQKKMKWTVPYNQKKIGTTNNEMNTNWRSHKKIEKL